MATQTRSKSRTPAGANRLFHELRHEHARFGRVLALIGRRARAWADAPDAETQQLLTEAVDYVVDFQNRYHHPREDFLFERIARRSAEHAAALAVLRRDHDKSHRAGQALLRQLRLLERSPGSRANRSALALHLENFARGMRGHIRREDELMYSSASKLLNAADWRALSRSAPTPPDPLLAAAGAISGPYAALAHYVAKGETESRVNTRPSHPLEVVLSHGTQLADRGISCLRLLSRQSREASRLGFSTYAAACRPRLPWNWGAGLARALNEQRLTSVRWIDEWREQLGIARPEGR